MRRIRVTIAPVLSLLAVLSLSAVAPPQSQFAGKWHTKISRRTSKASITLNILVNDGKLSGMVVLVNPDGSETELPIQKPEVNGKVFEFETILERTPFVWRLTLRGDASGRLRGSERRPEKGGDYGEMWIDEQVSKQ